MEDIQQCPGQCALDQWLLELLSVQPMTSAASTDTFVDMSTCVEPTLAGFDVDVVSGPVVIYLLMCVLVLNQL